MTVMQSYSRYIYTYAHFGPGVTRHSPITERALKSHWFISVQHMLPTGTTRYDLENLVMATLPNVSSPLSDGGPFRESFLLSWFFSLRNVDWNRQHTTHPNTALHRNPHACFGMLAWTHLNPSGGSGLPASLLLSKGKVRMEIRSEGNRRIREHLFRHHRLTHDKHPQMPGPDSIP